MLAAQPVVAICTLGDDLHGLMVQRALADRHGIPCHIIETDRLAGQRALSWSLQRPLEAWLPTRDSGRCDVRELDLIWWRRAGRAQRATGLDLTPHEQDVVDTDCRSTLIGACLASFSGRWVSDPLATLKAEQKLLQLEVARDAGLRIPRTLVSQDPDAIRAFVSNEPRQQVVLKAIRGTMRRPLFARRVGLGDLPPDEHLAVAPTIYQEVIEGTEHLRVHRFGRRTLTAMIETGELDWREDLRVPVTPHDLPTEVENRLGAVLDRLGLRMGVFDLKVSSRGEIVFLEVNPQGQFLFIQGLCGLELASEFADFLCDELAI